MIIDVAFSPQIGNNNTIMYAWSVSEHDRTVSRHAVCVVYIAYCILLCMYLHAVCDSTGHFRDWSTSLSRHVPGEPQYILRINFLPRKKLF